MAHLQVIGRNMIISVIGVGDAQSEWAFKTSSQTYKFLVSQLMRSVTDEPYKISLSIAAAVRCGLDHLDLCRSVNSLVDDKRFINAVTSFIGNRRAPYVYDGTVVEQVFDVLSGPPDDVQRIGNLYRFTACMAHQCTEKGAAILDPSGQLIALGVLHSSCAKQRPLQGVATDCFAHYTLTLFVREPEKWQNLIANLTSWARSEIAQSYTSSGMPLDRLDTVKVETVK